MKYVYRTQGTCSTNIELDVEEGVLKEVAYWGGCNGSLQGISRLVTGMKMSLKSWKVSDVDAVLLPVRISCVKRCMKWDIKS